MAVMLNLAKAFDIIDQDVFLNKLKTYGIRGFVLDLMKTSITSVLIGGMYL